MKGPVPKPAGVRRRQNRVVTAAVLRLPDRPGPAPALPGGRSWRAETLAWWADVWGSPMAGEFVPSDVHGLNLLAVLVDEFWSSPSAGLAAEIRLQRQCFGLTPIDRRRLQWEIDRGESAVEKTVVRRRPRSGPDPRSTLGR